MSSTPYLIARIVKELGIKELNTKELPLNALMMAWMAFNNKGQGKSSTVEVPQFANNLAKIMGTGKPVYLRDPNENRLYFVSPHGADLVAVFYAISPAYDQYAVIGSSPTVLETLGLTAPTFRDNQVIDRIFQFTKELNEETKPVVVPPVNPFHFTWHQPETPKEDVVGQDERPVQISVPDSKQRGADVRKRVTDATTGVGDNQMAHAFRAANQMPNERRSNRRHEENRNQQQQQPQETAA